MIKRHEFVFTDYHGGFLGGGGFVLERVTSPPVAKPNTAETKLERFDNVRNVFPETWLWSNCSIGYFAYMFIKM